MDGSSKPNAPRCSVCRKPAVVTFKPFCSQRCADVDLARWLTGAYAIPGGDSDADEDGDDAFPQPTVPDPGDRQ